MRHTLRPASSLRHVLLQKFVVLLIATVLGSIVAYALAPAISFRPSLTSSTSRCDTFELPTSQPGNTTAPDGLTIDVAPEDSYALRGQSLDDARAYMRACSPVVENGERFAAQVGHQLSWRYTYYESAGICRVTNASVVMRITQLYPSWEATTAADRVNWEKFDRALRTHEAGHVQINTDYAAIAYASLVDLMASDCTSLQQAVSETMAKTQEDLAQAHASYDSETKHGSTQNALL